MTVRLPRLALILLLGIGVVPVAFGQRPETEEKPWPRVGFELVFDGPKNISTLGTNARMGSEGGDTIIDIRNAGDGSGRLFLVQRIGKIDILQDGKLRPDPFLDISNLTNMRGERGLLSMAFPANYKQKGHFYVYYTDLQGNPTLARYKTDPANPNRALRDSAEILLTVPHPRYSNHNGGQLQFGPDGMLYFGIGDGGSARDPNDNGQNLGVLLAKMIRIDVEGPPDPGKPYRVPPDNPFVKNPKARPEIWALGVRNPWRFSFDPANGDMYIANVGQDLWEQIYYAPSTSKGGENYGWSLYEGTHDMKPEQPLGTSYPITWPVAEFYHYEPYYFKSITGGYVYRGAEYPAWQGIYFFSDWLSSQIWALRRDADGTWQTHLVDASKIELDRLGDSDNATQDTTDMAYWQHACRGSVTFGTDEKGNLYVSGFYDGNVYRLVERPAGQD
jgi:glucose/arabinose dehydrogenase